MQTNSVLLPEQQPGKTMSQLLSVCGLGTADALSPCIDVLYKIVDDKEYGGCLNKMWLNCESVII